MLAKQVSKYYPGVQTMEAQGYPAIMSSIHGMSAPAGTPPEIVDILTGAVKRAMDTDDYKKRMDEIGLEPRFQDSAQFAASWEQMENDVRPFFAAAAKK